MNLNQYAYYRGYLTPLPPGEKQRYQFWHPVMGQVPQSPEEMLDPMLKFFLSQKYLPVRKLPQPAPRGG